MGPGAVLGARWGQRRCWGQGGTRGGVRGRMGPGAVLGAGWDQRRC